MTSSETGTGFVAIKTPLSANCACECARLKIARIILPVLGFARPKLHVPSMTFRADVSVDTPPQWPVKSTQHFAACAHGTFLEGTKRFPSVSNYTSN